jgi:aquaporin Z
MKNTSESKYIIEFIGTFFLVLVVALTGNPLAIGGFLAAMVYAGGPISGGHYNPAVTFGIYLSRKISQIEALKYVGIQMLAGLVAAGVFAFVHGSLFLPQPAAHISLLNAFLIEVLFTFLLVHTILRVAADDRVKGNQYFGLAIGLALMAGAFAGGPISGGAYNPAVGVSPLLLDVTHLQQHFPLILLYVFGPTVGAGLASWVTTGSMKR